MLPPCGFATSGAAVTSSTTVVTGGTETPGLAVAIHRHLFERSSASGVRGGCSLFPFQMIFLLLAWASKALSFSLSSSSCRLQKVQLGRGQELDLSKLDEDLPCGALADMDMEEMCLLSARARQKMQQVVRICGQDVH